MAPSDVSDPNLKFMVHWRVEHKDWNTGWLGSTPNFCQGGEFSGEVVAFGVSVFWVLISFQRLQMMVGFSAPAFFGDVSLRGT